MSTTAMNGVNFNDLYSEKRIMPRPGVFPRKPDIRRIVREEIERQKKLDDLEQKYKNGEISRFEYLTNKMILTMPNGVKVPVVYSNNPTVEYMA